MAKSNRRRKKDRAKRQQGAAQRRRAAERRRQAEAAFAEIERHAAALHDPEALPDDVAAAIVALYQGRPVQPHLPELLADERGAAESLLEVGTELRRAVDGDPDASLTVLTFEAHVAYLLDAFADARLLLDRAVELADEVDDRLVLARSLVRLGRPVDALELCIPYLADLDHAVEACAAQAFALESIRLRRASKPDGRCPCGLGDSWPTCCQARDQAALDAFVDRSGLYELRAAVAEFMTGTEFESLVAEHVLDWRETIQGSEAVGDPDGLERLAVEYAWVAVTTDPDSEDDGDSLLGAVAAAPGTSPEIARRATAWVDHARYGLWQIEEPTPFPGMWCTDVCTGTARYVAFAPEQIENLPRWSVLLGPVAPIDGAWRAGGSMIRLTPSEADALYEVVHAMAMAVAEGISGRAKDSTTELAREPAPFGRAEPHTVYAAYEEPSDPRVADFMGRVVGTAMHRMISEVQQARAMPPGLVNTDGDPMLMITARIAVGDVGVTTSRLAARVDFDDGPGAGELAWYGKEVPPAQQATMLANLRAEVGADAVAEPTGPQRWVRGTLSVEDGRLRVEVNSRQRLDRLLAILERIGAEPQVVDQTSVDPRQDMAWPAGPTLASGGAAAPEEGWEKAWLDERVPALSGKTPRQAVGSDDHARLEALLRQFEHDADVLEQRGKMGVDVAWLREQLGMDDW